MVSNNHQWLEVRSGKNDHLKEFVRYLHLRETETYRQRLKIIKNLEKHKARVIREINQLLHDSLRTYEAQWHIKAKDIRDLREYLKALIKAEESPVASD